MDKCEYYTVYNVEELADTHAKDLIETGKACDVVIVEIKNCDTKETEYGILTNIRKSKCENKRWYRLRFVDVTIAIIKDYSKGETRIKYNEIFESKKDKTYLDLKNCKE